MTTDVVTTEGVWRERVRAWRASGETAAEFAQGRGFAPATLRYWSSRLGRPEPAGFVRLVPRSSAQGSGLVLEVAGVRLRVEPGFDPAALASFVRALSEAER